MFLRVARHTNDLERIENFYVDILGFERLGGFQNHNNYDGVFIGNRVWTGILNLHNQIQKQNILLMKKMLLYFIRRQF